VDYLAKQLARTQEEKDSSGGIMRRQKQCNIHEIADAVGKKPVALLPILERLKVQRRIEGIDYWWCVSDFELDGRLRR